MLNFGSRVRFVRGYSAAFSQALAGQFDAVGVVNEPIEDGVGNSGVPSNFMMPSSSIVYCAMRGYAGLQSADPNSILI